MHMWVDHAESTREIQVEQVQWVFGGPQASSYEDGNIVVIKANPVHQTTILELCLPLYLVYDS
jgi:hypothetical protein